MTRISDIRRRVVASAAALCLVIGAGSVVIGAELPDVQLPDEAINAAAPGLEIAEAARQSAPLLPDEVPDNEDPQIEDPENEGDVTDAQLAADNVASAAEKVAENVAGTPAEGIADAAVAAAAERVAENVENAIARAQAGRAGQGGDDGAEENEGEE